MLSGVLAVGIRRQHWLPSDIRIGQNLGWPRSSIYDSHPVQNSKDGNCC